MFVALAPRRGMSFSLWQLLRPPHRRTRRPRLARDLAALSPHLLRDIGVGC